MALWDLNLPPIWRKRNGKSVPVLTERGWEIVHANGTREVLVAIGGKSVEAGPADIVAVAFGADSYDQGDPITVIVTFNENVDVVSGATLNVAWTGLGEDFVVTASTQTGVNQVTFSGTVPSETGDLDIATQTILGTITDSVGGAASNLLITAEVAAEVEQISVA